jgi:ketosteroid isomerase-like protein
VTSPGRAAWDGYRAAVNTKDAAGLARLFAPNAVAVNPFGTFTGRHAVLGFYDQYVFVHDVTVESTHVIDAGQHCVVELDGTTPATPDVQHMVDLFTVGDDGRTTRRSIYRR